MDNRSERLGSALPATDEQIGQVRDMMFGRVLGIIIPTRNEQGEDTFAEIFNVIVEGPKSYFRVVWRSFATTRHSQTIDVYAGNKETRGFAPLNMLLTDTKSPDVYARLYTKARRVPEEGVRQALFDITAVRARRGGPLKIKRPEIFYEAIIERVTIPVSVMDGERHVGEGHTDVALESLSGFAARSIADFMHVEQPDIPKSADYYPHEAGSMPWQVSPGVYEPVVGH